MGVDAVALEFFHQPVETVIFGVQVGMIHLAGVAQAEAPDPFAHPREQGPAFTARHVLNFVHNDHGIFDIHAANIGQRQHFKTQGIELGRFCLSG